MSRLTLSVAAFVCFGALFAWGADDPTYDKPRQTSDKKPLPDAVPRASIVKLPVVGTRLDALPEEACGKVWELDTDIDFVNDSRHAFTQAGVDMTGFNYLGEGVAGYTRTALDVENGRVRKIILFRPGITDAVASETLAKIAADTQEKPTREGKNGFKFRQKGIHFYERPVGRWVKVAKGEHHPVVGGGSHDTADQKSAGPAAIEIGIEDDDWLAMNACRPTMLPSVQKGVLLKGMTPAEAFMTMKGHALYRQVKAAGPVWTWTDTKTEVQSYSTVSDEFGTRSVIRYVNKEQPIARASFIDGFVATIEDQTTLLAPPDGK